MKADEIGLLEFYREPLQIVASGSGGYSWGKEQCRRLWDDIVRAGKDSRDSGHSIGSIIYIEQGILSYTSIPRYLLVDGLQRLTTISLLLWALERTGGWREDSESREIHDCLLSNPQGRGSLRHTLALFSDDQDAFLGIVRGNPPSAGTAVAENYAFLKDLIEKSGVGQKIVYRGISKLTLMPISIDRYYENPGSIDEQIESTGLREDQKKLIRNWLGLVKRSQEE
jgi:hypothetical protein